VAGGSDGLAMDVDSDVVPMGETGFDLISADRIVGA
jgi:hypothetical protein